MLNISDILPWVKGQLRGPDTTFMGVSADTRTLKKNDLFVALKGERVDGHNLLLEARQKGATCALVERVVETSLPLIYVDNTLKALGQMAYHYRLGFSPPMLAITGSSGKTTVKEMAGSILTMKGETLITQGSLNTEVGVPLTLMRLRKSHRAAVIEMGARHKGDIQYLMGLVLPQVALITNAGVAHVEIFGSERGIAEAKGEIFSELSLNGTGVVNLDSPYAHYWKGLLKGKKIMTFGLSKEADVTAEDLRYSLMGVNFTLKTPFGSSQIEVNAPGEHSVCNALAAAAATLNMNASLDEVSRGLKAFRSISGRLQMKQGLSGAQLIDDTYNANPHSMRASLKVLSAFPGVKIFVMGDMRELGAEARQFHEEIGNEAKNLKIDYLLGVGENTAFAAKQFGDRGQHFSEKALLLDVLKEMLEKNLEATVLIKGSRGMKMEEVLFAIEDKRK